MNMHVMPYVSVPATWMMSMESQDKAVCLCPAWTFALGRQARHDAHPKSLGSPQRAASGWRHHSDMRK